MTDTDRYSILRWDKSISLCFRTLVFCWYRRFSDAHEDVIDERIGQPPLAGERVFVQTMLQYDKCRIEW